MKTKQRILAAIFFVLILAPMIAFPFVGLSADNLENRELIDFSEVTRAPIRNKPAVFREFFNDHLPFKNEIVGINSLVSMKLFRTTASPLVVVGEDGWLFFNNIGKDNPIDDVVGNTSFSDEEMELAKNNIDRRARELAEKGIDLRILIAPNKEAMYREYLPEYIRSRAAAESRTDRLVYFLNGEEGRVVYPKEELENEKAEHRLYYRYDTHWNALGAYLGAQKLYHTLEIELPDLDSYQMETGVPPKDLANLAAIGDFCRDDVSYTLTGFDSGVTFEREEIANGYVRYTSDAADNRTVLVIGDSYFGALRPYFYTQFSTVIEINRNATQFNPNALIEEYQPDIVILEMVERASSILLHDDILS